MNKTLFTKLLAVLAITAIIAVALLMIESTIVERKQFHETAVQSIAHDSVFAQSVVGPVLITPYTEEFEEAESYSTDDNQRKTRMVARKKQRFLTVYPENLDVQGKVELDQRYRGIHKVQVYTGTHQISGSFILPRSEAFDHSVANSRLTVGQAFVSIGISDVRGIHRLDGINWGGKRLEFQQGSGVPALSSGLHAVLDSSGHDADPATATPIKFSFEMKLDGMQTLSFTPVARNNQITINSRWPHPEFYGRFLPTAQTRIVTHDGFSATWDISALASNAQSALTAAINSGLPVANAAGVAEIDSFGVSFIEPINVYSMSERAVKYGLLFIVLTFSAFFLFEILKQLPIHPVQYGLVGFALALFFLLLLSLSEQITFLYAYLVASSACILLNGFYLAQVLHNWKRGFGFGMALTLLYSVLYGVLQSENNALLMGSILLFGVLAAIMIATRKVDWYRIGKDKIDLVESTISA